jgi:hypothetical protein
MPTRNSPQGQVVRRNFGRILPAHIEAFSRLLRALRVSFDGDPGLFLIMSVIAERTPNDRWIARADTLRKLLRDKAGAPGQAPINIQSVPDYTGIPRKTARRKTAILQRKGWVSRRADGELSVTEQAASDLEEATGHSVAHIAAILKA